MRLVSSVALLSGFCLAACGGSKAHSDGATDSGGGMAGNTVDGGSAGSGAAGAGPGGTSGSAGAAGVGPGGTSGSAGAAGVGPGGTGGSAGAGGVGPGGTGGSAGLGGAGRGGTGVTGGTGGALACGWKQSSSGGGTTGAGGAGIDPSVSCIAWRPKSSAWSTLPTSRPVNVGAPWEPKSNDLRPSADGKQIYAVAIWLEDGHNQRQIVRSPDLGATWCLIPTAAQISEVIPAPATASALYALTIPSAAGTTDVLRSRDGGATWATARGGLPETNDTNDVSLQVATDPNVIWLQGKNALHLSKDGADTWSTVALPKPPDSTAIIGSNVTVDPTMPQRLLVSGYRQTTPGVTEVPERPFILTSTNSGATWTERTLPTPTNPDKLRNFQVGIDQTSTVYLGLDTTDGLNASFAVWRSTNWAGSWTAMTGTGGGVPMTLGSHVAGVLFVYRSDGTFRSVDGGATWSPVTYPENSGALLAVSADRLIAKTPLSIANSTDGGASWKELPILPDQINPLVASPVAPYPLWGAAQAGSVWVVRSDDGVNWATTGANWPLFPDGASADVAYAAGAGATGLVQTADRGRTWQVLPTPTGGVGTLVAACPPPRSCIYVVQSTGSGTTTSVMSRSDDRGRTWSAATAVTNWGTRSSIVVSPDDPNLLLQGRDGGVYQTRDGGRTWNYVSISGQGVVGLAFLSGSEVLAVSDTRQLLHSSNGGDDWAVVSPNPMPVGFTRGIVRSVMHPGTLFVLTGGNPDAPLYRSDDGGATWKAQSPLGDGVGDFPYGAPLVTSIAETPCGFLGGVQTTGLVHFD